MSNSINIQKVVTRKIHGILHKSNVVPCVFLGWSTIKASTYWNALTVANGGVEVSGSIYGITTCTLKNAINDWFTSITIPSIAISAAYLYIGATAATHAINAWNPGTYDLSFNGGVTYTSQGCVYNGITGYANTGLIPSTILTDIDFGVSAKTSNRIGNSIFIGSKDDPFIGAKRVSFGYTVANLRSTLYSAEPAACQYTSRIDVPALTNGFNITQRESSTQMAIYQDGILLGNNITPSTYCATLPVIQPLYIGASNTAGTATNFFKGTLAFNHIGASIPSLTIPAFTTRTNDLMAVLGR